MGEKIQSTNKIEISIGTATKYIEDIVSIAGFKQSIYLRGPSGIGKSEIIKKLAKKFNSDLIDLRLGNLDIIDLNGIGIPDLEKKIAYWTRPEFFPPEKSNKMYILFLDEFNHATEAVFGAAYQLVLERRMGTHKLPDNVLIIAAGNGISDNGISFSLPSPLVNRFMNINVIPNAEEWIEYAKSEDISWIITSFIKNHPELLHRFVAKSNEDNFPTPRNYNKLNDFINAPLFNNDIHFRRTILNSLFGFGAMVQFETHLELIGKLPLMEELIKSQVNIQPLDTDLKSSYAFYMLVKSFLKTDRIETISNEELFNIIRYADSQSNQEVMQMMNIEIFSIINKAFDKERFKSFHLFLIKNSDLLSKNKEFKNKMIDFFKSMK